MSNLVKTVCIVAIFCLNASSTNAFGAVDAQVQQHTYKHARANIYSWSNIGHASSYLVILTPRGAGSSIIFNTSNTYISLSGIADGAYKVTVYGVFNNGNKSIIVQETISVGKKKNYPTTPPTQGSEDL